MVELRGFEPLTFSLRTRRATNCAIAPSCLNSPTSLASGSGRDETRKGPTSPIPVGNQGSGKTRRVTVEAGSVSGGLSYSSSIDSPSSTPSISSHGISSA